MPGTTTHIWHYHTYFWATHQGAEIDLVYLKGGRLYGVEIKRTDAPTMTRSMLVALKDLKLARITVVYPEKKRYSLHKKIDVVPFDELLSRHFSRTNFLSGD